MLLCFRTYPSPWVPSGEQERQRPRAPSAPAGTVGPWLCLCVSASWPRGRATPVWPARHGVHAAELAAACRHRPLPVSGARGAGLRALQGRRELERVVRAVKSTRDRMSWGPAGPPPLLVKVPLRAP